jgi:hypothetical protein
MQQRWSPPTTPRGQLLTQGRWPLKCPPSSPSSVHRRQRRRRRGCCSWPAPASVARPAAPSPPPAASEPGGPPPPAPDPARPAAPVSCLSTCAQHRRRCRQDISSHNTRLGTRSVRSTRQAARTSTLPCNALMTRAVGAPSRPRGSSCSGIVLELPATEVAPRALASAGVALLPPGGD